MAFEEHLAYYTPAPRAPALMVLDIILFWVPMVLGTLMYTMASFGWASVVQALSSNRFLEHMRLPLIIFFYSLIPFIVIMAIFGVVYNFSTLLIYCVLLIVVGLFEASVFLFLGIKILRIIAVVKQVSSEGASTEKRVRACHLFPSPCPRQVST